MDGPDESFPKRSMLILKTVLASLPRDLFKRVRQNADRT